MKIHICADDGELLWSEVAENPIDDKGIPADNYHLERMASGAAKSAAEQGFRILLSRLKKDLTSKSSA